MKRALARLAPKSTIRKTVKISIASLGESGGSPSGLRFTDRRKELNMAIPTNIKVNTGNDQVNHPSHYTNGGIECIDAIRASMTVDEFRGMLKGNTLKYLWRYRLKGKPVQDLEKAQWYLSRLIELEKEVIA
jgi:hypothetical protein